MKLICLILLFLPITALAQQNGTDTTENKIIVSEDVNDCINKIHNNPAAVKLFLRNLAQNPQQMRETYKELVNDPEVRRLVEEIRNNIRAEEEPKMQDRQY
jgi:hypothetical protein